MAQINIEKFMDYLSLDLKKALKSAVNKIIPNSEYNSTKLFKQFLKEVNIKCGEWKSIPNDFIQK